MSSVRILAGETERIQTPSLKDGSLNAVTGSTTVVVAIQRVSDGFWYDFNDDVFKSVGWTTRQTQMTEVSATLAPGEYRYDFDTSIISTPTADDTYLIHIDETGGIAINVPMSGEVKVDQWPAIIVEDTNAINIRLPSDPADESLQQVAHTQTQSDIAGLNNIDQGDVQVALTLQGYTSARAPTLDNLDTTISSRSDFDEVADPVELLNSGGTAGTSAAGLVTDIEANLATNHGSGQWDGIDSDWTVAEREQIRYRLAMDGIQTDPTTGAGTLEDILADTDAVDARLPADPADESLQQASHVQTQVDITTLNNLAQSDILSDATPFPGSNIDVAVSTRSDFNEANDPVELLDTGGVAGTSAAELVTDIEADLATNHGSGQWDGAGSDWTTIERGQIRFRLAIDGSQTDPTTGVGTLENILNDTDAIDSRLPIDPADESLQQAAHGVTQAAIASLNDLDSAGVQIALTTQGYTVARAALLSNLDAAISTVIAAIAALNNLSTADVQTAMTAQGYTSVRAVLLDALDVAISSRSSHTPANVDTQLSGIHGAGSWESGASVGDWSVAEREQMRDALGVDGDKATAVGGQLQDVLADTDAIDTRLPIDPADESLQQASHDQTQADIAALNNLDVAGIQAAMTAQGFTPTRATNLDEIDTGVHLGVAYDDNSTEIRLTATLLRSGIAVLVPTSGSITWYNPNGSVLFGSTVLSGPDSQGAMALIVTQILVDDQAYYVDVSISDSIGTVTQRRFLPTAA